MNARVDGSSPAQRVLFVCTGNTCRSPMAAAMFRELAREAGLDVQAHSAGVYALPGAPASAQAQRALSGRGLALGNHAARLLDCKVVGPDDLVLTMTQRHRDLVLAAHAALAGRVHVLREYVGTAGDPDVADPYGGSDADYEACARELETLLQQLVQKLKGHGAGSGQR